ncbi:MAG TPA: hypothetical protein VFB38_25005 [Chthonomonadaceae bacterium]|nr:hypothetical protein [Chthonomonadaceae bacterium]
MAGAVGADFHHRPSGALRFSSQYGQEAPPAYIHDVASQRGILEHPSDVQMLYIQDTEPVYQSAGELVMKVGSGACDPQMRFGEQDSGLLPSPALPGKQPAVLVAAGTPFQSALRLPQRSQGFLKRSGVCNGRMVVGRHSQPCGSISRSLLLRRYVHTVGRDYLVVSEGSKVLQAQVHSNLLTGVWQRLCFDLAADRGIPTIGFLDKGAGLGYSLQGTMQSDRDSANLGEDKTLAFQLDPVSPLWVAEGAIPLFALEPGRTRRLFSRTQFPLRLALLVLLKPFKEVLIGFLQLLQTVLEHLGEHA